MKQVADFLVKASAFVNEVAENYSKRADEAQDFLDNLAEALDNAARQAGAYDLGPFGDKSTSPGVDWSLFADTVNRLKDTKAGTQTEQTTQEKQYEWLVKNDPGNKWDRDFMRAYYLDPNNAEDLERYYNLKRSEGK